MQIKPKEFIVGIAALFVFMLVIGLMQGSDEKHKQTDREYADETAADMKAQREKRKQEALRAAQWKALDAEAERMTGIPSKRQ